MSTATAVKERPILMSSRMVLAILDGRKTQTRRVVKPQPNDGEEMGWYPDEPWHVQFSANGRGTTDFLCPYGKPGDRLWVRETWQVIGAHGGTSNPVLHYDDERGSQQNLEEFEGQWRLNGKFAFWDEERHALCSRDGWRPSIHMPRWASRITLEVTDVRVQLLQDISEADAQAEGCERIEMGPFEIQGIPVHPMTSTYAEAFKELWHTIHASNGPKSWAANPWLWCITFKRI